MGHFLIQSRAALICIVLLVATIVLGGGGTVNPGTEIALELVAVVCVLAWLVTVRGRTAPASVWILVGLVFIVPVLQLVPLPPFLWQALPGREMTRAALDLVGLADSWRPVSLVPAATLSSLLALGPPLALLWMVSQLDLRERQAVLLAIAVTVFAGGLLGAAQVVGGRGFYLYDYSHFEWLTGFQANRNAEADVLVIGLLAFTAAQAARGQARAVRAAIAAVGVGFLALATVLTGSRTGIAILAVMLLPVVFAHLRLLRVGNRRIAATFAAGILTLPAAVWLALRVPSLTRAVERFDGQRDFRLELWTDGWSAALAYWPIGGGVGGFVQLFLPFERLEVLDETSPNRAHNDYLEWLIEAGLPGIAVLLAVAIVVAVMILQAWKRYRAAGGKDREVSALTLLFSCGTLTTIAAHSILDYPLRSMAIAGLLAVAAGLLTRPTGTVPMEGSRP
ncbi:O-antigen ligase family protein [Croceicoccus sp. BE223]|uniref:O-antigen ligase family protein n=1 Tax=Croceicoccus sp. BE223 TaxID=2817716 RepID=UPI00285FF65E|nr:O-antigen ligase family protein [Croceicoccus sp. BE223]MDR7102065.1 O-antigen ligase [Croceicoccus sp. BE223]